MTANPPSAVIRALPSVVGSTAWELDTVRSALDAHEQGFFDASAPMVDAMGRDDRVGSCLTTRVRALASRSGLPFKVEPSDENKKRGAAVAKLAERVWWDVHPEWVLDRVLRDAIMLGVAVGQLRWRKVDGVWRPRMHPLPAHHLRWDAQAEGWTYATQDGPIPINPGDGAWYVYTPGGTESWLAGAVRLLGEAWAIRRMSYTDWLRYCEKHGLPILAVIEPESAEEDPTREKFYQRLKRLGRESTVRLTRNSRGEGYDLKYVEPADTSWQSFQAMVEAANLDIAIGLLGQNLTTEISKNGARASADIHDRIRRVYLAADSEGLSTFLREQIWIHWGRYGVKNWDDRLAPWGRWNVDPPEDLAARAQTLSTVADVLTKLSALGVPVDVQKVCEEYKIPLRDGAAIPEPEADDAVEEIEPEAAPEANEGGPDAQMGDGKTPDDGAPAQLQAPLDRVPALITGQVHADTVADNARNQAARAIRDDVASILEAIDGASSYEEIRARVLARYEAMTPARLAAVTEKALVLAGLGGRLAVLEDL